MNSPRKADIKGRKEWGSEQNCRRRERVLALELGVKYELGVDIFGEEFLHTMLVRVAIAFL